MATPVQTGSSHLAHFGIAPTGQRLFQRRWFNIGTLTTKHGGWRGIDRQS